MLVGGVNWLTSSLGLPAGQHSLLPACLNQVLSSPPQSICTVGWVCCPVTENPALIVVTHGDHGDCVDL